MVASGFDSTSFGQSKAGWAGLRRRSSPCRNHPATGSQNL